jgi:flagellar hook protein FlgE
MTITSPASVSAIQAAFFRQDVTAHNVANVNTDGYGQRIAYQTDQLPEGTRISHLAQTPNTPGAPSNTDLVQSSTEQLDNKTTVKANVNVIKAKDQMVGTLLDMVG